MILVHLDQRRGFGDCTRRSKPIARQRQHEVASSGRDTEIAQHWHHSRQLRSHTGHSVKHCDQQGPQATAMGLS